MGNNEDIFNFYSYPSETPYFIPISITNHGNGLDTISLETFNTTFDNWMYYFGDSESLLTESSISIYAQETVTINLLVQNSLDPKYNFSKCNLTIKSESGDAEAKLVKINSHLLIPELEFTGRVGTPGAIIDAAPITVEFEIRNTGFAASGQFFVEFYDNGELVDTKSVSLLEGETAIVAGNWELQLGDFGEHEIEAKIKYGDQIIENDISNNVASFVVDVSFNGLIWIPIASVTIAYIVIALTLRLTYPARYKTVLDECSDLNKKIRLDKSLALLDGAKRNSGIIGTLLFTRKSFNLISKAELIKESTEQKYKMVLDKRDELFNMVSMLKERGLDYTNAEETLTEVQRQLNALRPDNYAGLEMPDAEKFENKSISDLGEIQEATVVEILEDDE